MRRCVLQFASVLISLIVLSTAAPAAHKKKDEEPKPQILPLPKELPRALSTETASLSFRVTPLLKTGHLSMQIRDSLVTLIRDTRGETIVKLRAFVSGAGDSRRVQELVSDMFTERKLPLPVLTIIQVGALGNDAAAIVMEAVVSDSEEQANPHGLAFLAGQTAMSLPDALAQVVAVMKRSGLSGKDTLSATCFADRLTDYAGAHSALAAAFPEASINVVQALRDPVDSSNTCEAIARLPRPLTKPVQKDSRISYVTEAHVVFTGMQLSFGTYLDDADSALSRLQRDLEAVHAGIQNAVSVNAFSLEAAAASALQKTIAKFKLPPNTLTVQPVEGLPSLDAALGMEAVLTGSDLPKDVQSAATPPQAGPGSGK